MIFVIGAILTIFGANLSRHFGSKEINRADYIGIPMAVIGVVMMAVSIGILAWRYLP